MLLQKDVVNLHLLVESAIGQEYRIMLKRLLEYTFLYWNDSLRLLWPFYLFFMVVRPRVPWTYVQRVYARTSLGGKDVRPEGAWTYVHRTFERAWMGMNETCVKSIDSEQFLNGNEWDRGTRKEWHITTLLQTLHLPCIPPYDKEQTVSFFRIDWRLNFKKRGNIKNGFLTFRIVQNLSY